MITSISPPRAQAEESLALYIHWPFCLSKCPYCDFNSHVRERIPTERFIAALRRELAYEANLLGRRKLTSIFFGGGTPSLMPPEGVAALISDAQTLFKAAFDIEITLEANPTSVEAERLSGFRDAGVNRISLGIQSLRDDALAFLGREHSARQAISALEMARGLFPRVTFDLIYARPGQSLTDWRAELDQALTLVADHVSLYQLTIEQGTRFEGLHRQGRIVLPDEDLAAALYAETGEIAARHGLMAYEVSNYASPGAESRHNLTYWHYRDYLGIGPGAHGRVTRSNELRATRRHRAPEIWADLVERTGSGQTDAELLETGDRAREMLLMGLRLSEGVEGAWFRTRTGMTLDEAIDDEILTMCLQEGYLERRNDRLRATPEGRLRLEAILPRLVV
ncbi:radical SAM family heme chaperone HemW [Acetobacter oeni]|uniref:Heme chaperone HemW n=1 Tax=Acetobacter oeni TaxID=304077 RepID=A0A511XPZ5_9PROT|nr:radical SAM family heme chaperone HemW [Acetobacter oeni]MBB3883641.1 oxygen-independent coproporphyrinogen-3 oxidase [Acetobacter oeni]NHO19628.1 coproporphyrinogen III oxidase [Acetobacter oeni]GEN64979.1 coproporphyrinogen III oxidase [Acetobacter oeni]